MAQRQSARFALKKSGIGAVVERAVRDGEADSSNLSSPTDFLSVKVYPQKPSALLRDAEVPGSSPGSPTKFQW